VGVFELVNSVPCRKFDEAGRHQEGNDIRKWCPKSTPFVDGIGGFAKRARLAVAPKAQSEFAMQPGSNGRYDVGLAFAQSCGCLSALLKPFLRLSI